MNPTRDAFTGVAHATPKGFAPSLGTTTTTVVVGNGRAGEGGGARRGRVATLDVHDRLHPTEGGENSHMATSVSAVGGLVAVGFADTDGVQLYRTTFGGANAPPPTLERASKFHEVRLGRGALALNRDATQLCVPTGDGGVAVYVVDEAMALKPTATPRRVHGVAGLAWSQHLRTLFGVACDDDGTLKLFDTRVLHDRGVVSAPRLKGQSITAPACLAFHPAFPEIVAAGYTLGHLAFWDMRALREPCGPIIRANSPCGVRCVRFCEAFEQSTVVTGGGAGMVDVWDFPSGRSRMHLTGHTAPVVAMDFHPAQASQLVTCARDSSVRQWVIDPAVALVENKRSLITEQLYSDRGGASDDDDRSDG